MGGSPVKVAFDNPPSIVAVRLGPIYLFQERLRALAAHYGFTPVAVRVAHPRDKAKIERPFQDIDRAFLYGRTFESLADLNEKAVAWLDPWNARDHGTTRERPIDRLEEERKILLALPARPFDLRVTVPVTVAPDFTVAFDGVRYSVPPRLVGERERRVLVRANEAAIEVVAGEEVVARHERSGKKGARIVLEEHRAELRALKREAREAALARRGEATDPDGYDRASRELLSYGDDGERYLAALVATYRGGARHELRRTLEVRERVGEPAFKLALSRAATYGAAGAQVIERIALDLVRRGEVERRGVDPATGGSTAVARPEVSVRPLSYYHEILEAEARATPEGQRTEKPGEQESEKGDETP